MEPDLPPDQSPPPAEEQLPASPTDPLPDAGDEPLAAEPTAEREETPPPPPAPPSDPGHGSGQGGVWAPPFQFLRSKHERKLGGVAGGLAVAGDLDPTLVRLAIVLGCLTGWGILAYFIAWAVIPEENPAIGRHLVVAPERTAKHVRIGLTVVAALGVLHVVGAMLGIVSSALIGLGLFPARLFGLSHRGFMPGEALLGLFLLVGGLLLLFRRHFPWATDASGGAAWYPGPSGSSTAPGAAWSPSPDPGTSGPGGASFSDTPGGATTAGAGGYGPPPPSAGSRSGGGGGLGSRASAAASAAARAARTNGPLLLARAIGWLVVLWFFAAAVVGGALWATGALRLHLPVLPIVTTLAALGVLGYTLVRSRRVVAVVGAMALLLVPTGLAAALTRVDGQVGNRTVTPTAIGDIERTYRHAVGVFHLDLTRLHLPAGSRIPVDISMGAGKIEVTVPWDAEVDARASVGAGTFFLLGNRQAGVNLKARAGSTASPPGGGPALVIRSTVGAGAIEVRQAYEPYYHQALRFGKPVPLSCGPGVNGSLRCLAPDGDTTLPALGCVVSDSGAALCRPVGEPEPAVDYANDPGTRHCQVPAGGGDATCSAPVPGTSVNAGSGSFTCSIPEGGGPSVCKPSGAGGGLTSNPGQPAPPAAPVTPVAPAAPGSTPTGPPSPPATAAPGEYHCTVPEGGGPATCEPA